MRRSRLPFASLLASLLAGCAAPPVPNLNGDPLAAAPDDFTLEVAVLAGAEAAGRPEAHLRPARFILLADGALHYAPADEIARPGAAAGEEHDQFEDLRSTASVPVEGRRGNWLPPLTRVLDRGAMAAIWSRARQLGFIEAGDAGAVNFAAIAPRTDEIVHAATFRANGRRWSVIHAGAAADAPDAAMTELIRLLASLAWASDAPAPETRTIPKRYDFGPDPYARYRE